MAHVEGLVLSSEEEETERCEGREAVGLAEEIFYTRYFVVLLNVFPDFGRVGSTEDAVGQIAFEETGMLVSKTFAMLRGP